LTVALMAAITHFHLRQRTGSRILARAMTGISNADVSRFRF
jgi:hypothetical protein